MSRVLFVGEAARSIGEFRRPWVRAAFGAYARRYRERLQSAIARSAASDEVLVLAARECVDRERLGANVGVRRWDEEAFAVRTAVVRELGRRLVAAWWPARDAEPGLLAEGVWLPDVLPVSKGILLRLELLEQLDTIERAFEEHKPEHVLLLTGASSAERLARAFAADRGVPVEVVRRSVTSRLVAGLGRVLRVRQERQALRHVAAGAQRAVPAAPRGSYLFSVNHARHFVAVRPLTETLTQAGTACTVISALLDEASHDADTLRFTDYLTRGDITRDLRALAPVRRRLRRRLRGAACATSLRHGSVALEALVRPFASDAVTWSLPIARLYVAAAARALDELAPQAVVIASDRRFAERALALAARARGIPTLLFWGASILARDRTNEFDVTDRVLVMGDHVAAALADQGVPRARIAVVGDPRSNAASLVPRPELRREIAERFRLDPGRPLVILVSKYVSVLFSAEEKAALYRTVREAVRRAGGPNLVVKVHPNEDLALLRRQVQEWGWPEATLTQDYDIHRLFRAADAAVMVTSMAGIEAMAMGCPVIAVQTPGKDFEGEYMPHYVTEQAVERVDIGAPAAVAAALTRLLEQPQARAALVARGRSFAARYLHPVDGRLADRIRDLVREVTAERARGAR